MTLAPTIEQKAKEAAWSIVCNEIGCDDDSCLNRQVFAKETLLEFAAEQVAEERARCADVASRWRAFYSLMQEKSKNGEKDGLYRAMAADDIHRDIINPAPPEDK